MNKSRAIIRAFNMSEASTMFQPEPNPHLKVVGVHIFRVNGVPAPLNRGYLDIRLLRRAYCVSRAEGIPEHRFLNKNRE